jgi:hypothetical protein
MAVLSFVKIIAQSREERKLYKYRHNDVLTKRMPGYSVKMGYGMHIGWAIEGAIGSFYKIDASYLSPHVNMSGKLEETTKAYGVMLLLTGELYENFTPKTKTYMRSIDVVLLTGPSTITKLYTCDVDWECLGLEPPTAKQTAY